MSSPRAVYAGPAIETELNDLKSHFPANTRHSPMLFNNKTALGECPVFAEFSSVNLHSLQMRRRHAALDHLYILICCNNI